MLNISCYQETIISTTLRFTWLLSRRWTIMSAVEDGEKLGCLYIAAAAKSLQSCPTLCDPMDCSLPGFSVMEFSRQEHWSGLPFPSPYTLLVGT